MDFERISPIGWVAAGALIASLVIAGWLVIGSDEDGLEDVVTVDAAGDTLVYSGPVRDAIARARIIEAFNSVAVAEADSDSAATAPAEPIEGDAARRVEAARSAREAAIDALARLYVEPVEPEALLEALNLAIVDFEPGSADVPRDAAAFLRAAAETAGRTRDHVVVVVEGHAAGGESAEADLALSLARARAVADALVAAGFDSDRVRAEGLGSGRDPDDGRAEGGHIVFDLVELEPEETAATGDEAAGEP